MEITQNKEPVTKMPAPVMLLNSYENLKQLTAEENKIAKLKYSSPVFAKMSESDLFIAANEVIVKINIINGWVIPEEKTFMNALIEQLSKKLIESYPNANMNEIEYAFRNNTTVKDWGKSMNLALIDEVMMPYLAKRFEVSRLEEQAKKPAQIEYPSIEMTDEELLEATFETFKLIKKHEFIPVSVYDYLVKEGEIILTDERKIEIKKHVKTILKTAIANDLSFAHSYDIIGDKQTHLNNECKKYAVAIYFNSLILKGC